MKLASIERIIDLAPIEGADRIELATVLGWEVVVKKGDFNIEDLCIYIPIKKRNAKRKNATKNRN